MCKQLAQETLENAIRHFILLHKHSECLALPWDALGGCEDSILVVQSARETLENAIRMVEAHPRWRARVVYGDTDSLFVLLPGRSREEAFQIGSEIAAAATAANPPPVTLKMEKVRGLSRPSTNAICVQAYLGPLSATSDVLCFPWPNVELQLMLKDEGVEDRGCWMQWVCQIQAEA